MDPMSKNPGRYPRHGSVKVKSKAKPLDHTVPPKKK